MSIYLFLQPFFKYFWNCCESTFRSVHSLLCTGVISANLKFYWEFFLKQQAFISYQRESGTAYIRTFKTYKVSSLQALKVFFFCTCWFHCTEMKNRTSIYSLFCLFYTWMSLYSLIILAASKSCGNCYSLSSSGLAFNKKLPHIWL